MRKMTAANYIANLEYDLTYTCEPEFTTTPVSFKSECDAFEYVLQLCVDLSYLPPAYEKLVYLLEDLRIKRNA